MFTVYILYSASAQKTYVGFTADVNRRLAEHNVTKSSGFTLRYRPWTLIHSEEFVTKKEAMEREKFYKSGKGREGVKEIVTAFLQSGKA